MLKDSLHKKFLQDFRQDNNGFRGQFYEGQKQGFKGVEEVDDYVLAQQSNNKKNDSNRRLDLVA